jgi:hypothetical protein
MKNFIVALDIDETLLTTLTTPEHEARVIIMMKKVLMRVKN